MSRCHPHGRLTFSGLATGKSRPIGACASSVAALPTDPIGTVTVTLTNVVVGSRISIRDQANTTTRYDQIADASTVIILLDVYAAGSSLNDLKIDIRKGSAAPFYQRFKTLMTATVGSFSIYVNQLPDQR